MIDRCYLEITNVCNLRCVFCAGHRRAPRMMSREEFELLTDRLRGRVRFLYFHLMGEPMMNPLLPSFVRSARAKGFIPVITTNGTLLDVTKPSLTVSCADGTECDNPSCMASELLESVPYKINISLHSHEGNPGSVLTTEDYVRTVSDFSRMAAANGTIVVLRLWNNGGYDAENEEIISLLHQIVTDEWTRQSNGFKLADRLFLEYDSMFEWPEENGEECGEESFCYALRNQFGVLVDGSVVPCCLDHDGNMTLGNLFSQPLDEILSSERARRIFDGFTRHKAVEPLCRRCGYAMKTKRYRQ